MKKAKWIVVGVAALLPLASMAEITVTAFAGAGRATLFEPGNSTPIQSVNFSGGTSVVLDTSSLSQFSSYGITVWHENGTAWGSDIYWADAGNNYWRNFDTNGSYSVTALSGKITDRTLGGSSVSVTLSSTGPNIIYDNEDNAMDAKVGLYQSAASDGSNLGSVTVTKRWNSGGLGGDFAFSTSGIGGAYQHITVTSNGSFYADYLGRTTDVLNNPLPAGTYDLQFVPVIEGLAFDDGSISGVGNDVTFTVDGTVGTLDDYVPYYVMMDEAWIYDAEDNVSLLPDVGLELVSPDHYTVPEPATILLLVGSGGLLMGVRRLFMI